MKKRILSVLLILCMICSLLPIYTAALVVTDPEDVTFGYAYDAQRSPSYPGGADTQIEFRSFNMPLDQDGNRKNTHTGSWTLQRAGTYAYLKSIDKDSAYLSRVMDSIADEYSVNINEILAYELKENGSHIAYGVVIAYNADEGYAAFIGDTHWSGAGYLLSTDEVTQESVTITADKIATDFVPARSIALDKAGTQTFESKNAGYQQSELTALTVTVTNSGNTDTGALNVSLSGNNADSFLLDGVDAAFQAGIAKDSSDTFAVAPKTGLAAGTYTATVTVSGVDVASQTFNVTFTVKAATYAVTVNNGTGDGQYTEGASVTITADAAHNSKKFKEWTGVEGLTFTAGSATTATATFTMPAKAVSVTATYEAMALEEVTFGYAYDAYRSPAYPQGADTQIEFDNFRTPLINLDGTRKDVNTGSWTLSKAGTYFYIKSIEKDSTALAGVMRTVANEYGVNADEILVYELKDNGTHIAYGVVIAYNAEEGYAAYIGDTYYGGAGYLLSLEEVTDRAITITADMIATDFVPSRSIALDKTGTQTFESKIAGYQQSDLSALTVTVTNNGNTDTGALNVSLSGNNVDSFLLDGVDDALKAGIAKDSSDTFTVIPKADLAAGTYTATVTVSGVDVASESFNVTFTVNAPTYTVTVSGGTGDGEYAEGAEVTITADAAPNGKKFKEWTGVEGLIFTNGSKTSATAAFTMPGKAVSITATYEDITYAVTVIGGAGSGEYVEGVSVTIIADTAPEGKQFKEWTGVEGLAFTSGSKTSATATFTMPANAVIVTAAYEDIPVYAIVKGDGSTWTKGSSGNLSFTADGPIEKFVGIKMDGKEVDAKNYEVKTGSTVINLKASYLETLAVGEHTITVIYADGETSGTFKINPQPSTPVTGDDFNIALWSSVMFVSLAAPCALLILQKKSSYTK